MYSRQTASGAVVLSNLTVIYLTALRALLCFSFPLMFFINPEKRTEVGELRISEVECSIECEGSTLLAGIKHGSNVRTTTVDGGLDSEDITVRAFDLCSVFGLGHQRRLFSHGVVIARSMISRFSGVAASVMIRLDLIETSLSEGMRSDGFEPRKLIPL